MLTRLYWTQCTLARSESQPIDTFWLEATQKEAEALIFPYCSARTIAKSQAYGIRDREIALKFDCRARSYCFLIAQDLSTIEPFAVHYPYSPMWNARSPFKKIVESYFATLEDLKNFVPIIAPSKTVLSKKEDVVSLLV